MRHDNLLRPDGAALLVVDIQDAFAPHIHEMDRVVQRSRVMIQAAQALEIPIIVTEQYPKGLGRTVEPLLGLLAGQPLFEKTAFSCMQDDAIAEAVKAWGRPQIILVGIEAHVCISQTSFDLLHEGLQPYLAVDAVSSRRPHDAEIALQRLSTAGATTTTTEAAIMEMTVSSKHPQFKEISKIIK